MLPQCFGSLCSSLGAAAMGDPSMAQGTAQVEGLQGKAGLGEQVTVSTAAPGILGCPLLSRAKPREA